VSAATSYELRVDGHLDAHWSEWLGDLELVRRADGTSTLRGPVADQAQLHGLLAGLRDIGATLLSVSALEPEPPAAMPWPRRTERLLLRPAGPEDAEPTWRYRRLEPVARWLTELPRSLGPYRDRFSDPARLATTIIVECDGRVIGDLMLRTEDAWAQAEIRDRARATQAELGWVLDPAHTGHGYATEAVEALLRVCFEDLDLRRVAANCFADNEASWRLMERLGMRRETHTRQESLHRSGRWLDGYGYALLQTEWEPSSP
jgi:RimJ/RimL family protein N-acetyltransferase